MLIPRLNYTKYYLGAILIIAVVAILGHLSLRFVIDNHLLQEPVIEVNNQQKVLSQRLAFYCLYLTGDAPDKDNDEVREKIKGLKKQMLQQHLALQNGNSALNLEASSLEELQDLFFSDPNRLDDKINQYFAAVDNLLSTPDQELRWDHPSLVLISDDAEEGYLLASMTEVTNALKSRRAGLKNVQLKMQWGILALLLVCLGLVARFLFHPMLEAMEKKEKLLKERNQKLLVMCKRMVKPARKQRRKEKAKSVEPLLLLPEPKRKKRLFYTSVPELED